MSDLLYITGQIDNPFFLNEIEDFAKAFHKIIVLTYADNSKRCEEISKRYGFQHIRIGNKPTIIEALTLIKRLFERHTIKEIREKCRWNVKKIGYLCIYELFAIKVERTIRKQQISLEHMNVYSFWLSRGAYAAARLKRIMPSMKAVSRAHGYDLYEDRNSFCYLPFRPFIATSLDAIAFISDNGKKYFENYCAINSINVKNPQVIHLGTNKTDINFAGDIKKERLVIASCSRVVPLKRLDLIIDLISKVRELDSSAFWIHIGDGEDRATYERYAKEKLREGYRFYGNVDNDEILTIYRKEKVSFFVNMSDSEGIPVSIMEAMSVGIPAIGRDVGGIKEIINNRQGFLINEEVDSISLTLVARDIVNLYNDNGAYLEFSKNAREYWFSEFYATRNNQRMIELISD